MNNTIFGDSYYDMYGSKATSNTLKNVKPSEPVKRKQAMNNFNNYYNMHTSKRSSSFNTSESFGATRSKSFYAIKQGLPYKSYNEYKDRFKDALTQLETDVLVHNSDVNNKKCIIIVPAYKTTLTKLEKISIQQTVAVFGNKYEIAIMCPKGLDLTEYYKHTANFKFAVLEVSPKWFTAISSYSRLCEEPAFYKHFLDYEYMLICQLDAYVTEDMLDKFIAYGFDYYGAQVKNFKSTYYNGGLSLRRTKAIYDTVCANENIELFPEDYFLCRTKKQPLKVNSFEVSKKFSIQHNNQFDDCGVFGYHYIDRIRFDKMSSVISKTFKGEYLNASAQKNKTVVFTCITGGYDQLLKLKYINPSYDYICYTDNLAINPNGWTLRPIPEKLKNLTNSKINRYVKWHPHEFFPEYELSIYIDGCIDILSDFTEIIEKYPNDFDILVPKHNYTNCIYQEARHVVNCKRDVEKNFAKQLQMMRDEGFPANYGMTQNNILIRHHNNKNMIDVENIMWNVIKDGSHRDQLVYKYAVWKNGNLKEYILDKNTCNSKYFTWYSKHPKAKK